MIPDLRELQTRRRKWAKDNFGVVPGWQNALGVAEEAGELCHAILKSVQAIRGYDDPEKLVADVEDAVGDICMYLMGVCDNHDLNFDEVIESVSSRVMKRDWKSDPILGDPR